MKKARGLYVQSLQWNKSYVHEIEENMDCKFFSFTTSLKFLKQDLYKLFNVEMKQDNIFIIECTDITLNKSTNY